MAIYVITEACLDVKDKSCVEVCPVDCIHDEPADRMSYIDPDSCTGCHACLPACPVGAIFTDEDLPAQSAAFAEINRSWFSDRHRARQMVEEISRSS